MSAQDNMNQQQFKLHHEPGVNGHYEQTDRDYPGHNEWQDDPPETGRHMLTASTGNNKSLGVMTWDKGVVQSINVDEKWQHKGMGSQMWKKANEITPGLSHSDNRTEAGEAFAKKVGGPKPERMQEHPEWFE